MDRLMLLMFGVLSFSTSAIYDLTPTVSFSIKTEVKSYSCTDVTRHEDIGL
jgi:hypothetical protein